MNIRTRRGRQLRVNKGVRDDKVESLGCVKSGQLMGAAHVVDKAWYMSCVIAGALTLPVSTGTQWAGSADTRPRPGGPRWFQESARLLMATDHLMNDLFTGLQFS